MDKKHTNFDYTDPVRRYSPSIFFIPLPDLSLAFRCASPTRRSSRRAPPRRRCSRASGSTPTTTTSSASRRPSTSASSTSRASCARPTKVWMCRGRPAPLHRGGGVLDADPRAVRGEVPAALPAGGARPARLPRLAGVPQPHLEGHHLHRPQGVPPQPRGLRHPQEQPQGDLQAR